MARYVLALDQGTTSSRAILFDHAGRVVAAWRSASSRRSSPRRAWVEHDPEDIWTSQLAARARMRCARPGAAPTDIAAIGITNQRETTIVWERDRAARPQRHRLAEPPHRRPLRRAEGARAGRHRSARKTGLVDRRLLLRHQAQVAARQRPRRARARRARRAALRHRRHLPHLAAHRRPRARHRLLQRLAHAALQHPHAATGTTSCCASSASRAPMLPRVLPSSARLRRDRPATSSARPSPSPASRATSRRRPSARPASRPAWRRTPTAPAASCC